MSAAAATDKSAGSSARATRRIRIDAIPDLRISSGPIRTGPGANSPNCLSHDPAEGGKGGGGPAFNRQTRKPGDVFPTFQGVGISYQAPFSAFASFLRLRSGNLLTEGEERAVLRGGTTAYLLI